MLKPLTIELTLGEAMAITSALKLAVDNGSNSAVNTSTVLSILKKLSASTTKTLLETS